MVHLPAIETLGLFAGGIGWMEVTILALLGVLIFGKRLPEVGKSLGRGIVEFKRGLSGIDEEVELAAKRPSRIEQHSPEQAGAESESPDRAKESA